MTEKKPRGRKKALVDSVAQVMDEVAADFIEREWASEADAEETGTIEGTTPHDTIHLKMGEDGIEACTEEESRAYAESLGVIAEPVEPTSPAKGPDYHITPTGEILLDATGDPVPEDHHIHPAHRLLALARKDATR